MTEFFVDVEAAKVWRNDAGGWWRRVSCPDSVSKFECTDDVGYVQDHPEGWRTGEPCIDDSVAKKYVVIRRYYPVYHGRKSKRLSYRSYFIGQPRKNSADRIIGTCDASAEDGWVRGVKGATAARTKAAIFSLPAFEYTPWFGVRA